MFHLHTFQSHCPFYCWSWKWSDSCSIKWTSWYLEQLNCSEYTALLTCVHKNSTKPEGVDTIWRHGLNHICPIVPNPASTCMHPCYKTFSPVVIRVLSGQIRMLSLDLHLMIIFYNKLSAVIILNIKDIYFYYHK